ncbi:MAG TPA: hypothetical protein PKH77_24270 [Anaerolineae bacterium]|nr:hypothetical protein [Anaerolineae bacterium]
MRVYAGAGVGLPAGVQLPPVVAHGALHVVDFAAQAEQVARRGVQTFGGIRIKSLIATSWP